MAHGGAGQVMAKSSKQLRWCKECGKDKYIEVKLHAPTGDRIVFCVSGHALAKIVSTATGRYVSSKKQPSTQAHRLAGRL